jgi:DNA repair protein RecO (recombination protein O)
MNPRSYSDEGIILARRNYGEADRILSVYTRNHGRISYLAKGIRRLTSKKRGHLEIFSQIRFQASHGKGLDLITEVETVENFNLIRKNLKKVSLAYYFVEVVGRITREGQSHPELFYLIKEYLNQLKIQKELKRLRLDFILKLLVTLGFWPRGKVLVDPDKKLEEVLERQINSIRVGRRILEEAS